MIKRLFTGKRNETAGVLFPVAREQHFQDEYLRDALPGSIAPGGISGHIDVRYVIVFTHPNFYGLPQVVIFLHNLTLFHLMSALPVDNIRDDPSSTNFPVLLFAAETYQLIPKLN
ncbi:hypothetical protein EMIT091MI3_50213 [Kosakonia quasisacchari]